MVQEAEAWRWRSALEQGVVTAVMLHLSLRAVINVPFIFTSPASAVWTKSLGSAN